MFQLSWEKYLIFLGGALAVYYLYIGLTYYRKELIALLRGTGRAGSPQPPPTIDPAARKKRVWHFQEVQGDHGAPDLNASGPAHGPDPLARFAPQETPDFEDEGIPAEALEEGSYEEEQAAVPEMEALQTVVTNIRDLFSTLEVPIDQDQLLFSIREELSPFPSLAAQPYKIAINNLIATEAQERFGLSLKERELATIWPPTG